MLNYKLDGNPSLLQMSVMSNISPISTGLSERCPTCGEGRIWRGYLKLKPSCAACGQDFTQTDTADGPAFFVGFAVLIIFAPFGFIIGMADQPIWAKLLWMLLLTIVTIVASLVMLPKAKSLMVSLQIANKAKEAELDKS